MLHDPAPGTQNSQGANDQQPEQATDSVDNDGEHRPQAVRFGVAKNQDRFEEVSAQAARQDRIEEDADIVDGEYGAEPEADGFVVEQEEPAKTSDRDQQADRQERRRQAIGMIRQARERAHIDQPIAPDEPQQPNGKQYFEARQPVPSEGLVRVGNGAASLFWTAFRVG